MNNINYEKILEKISKTSNLDKEEVRKKVEAKRAKLSDLISYEGAAQIVAVELGVNFDNEKSKINELVPGMRKVNTMGKIINLAPVRTFKNKQGGDSKVVSFTLADEGSNIRVVLWDSNHISLIEDDKIKEGSVIEIINATMRNNELHLGNFSELNISDEILGEVVTEKIVQEKKIEDFVIADNVKVRAFIVQSFEPRFFNVCPECNKKVSTDGQNFVCIDHGKILAKKKALINIVLDDGTGTIRAVVFHSNLSSIGLKDLEDVEKLTIQRGNLLGKELIFFGQVRQNKFFNEMEFIVDEASEVNLDESISNLEGMTTLENS